MNTVVAPIFGTLNPSGLIPENIKHKRRFAFAFLVDVSGSTGSGAIPDIEAINIGLGELFDTLRNPDPASELALYQDQIDICVVAYDERQYIELDWTMASSLPTNIHLSPRGTTATADAFDFMFQMIADRLRFYKNPGNKISAGLSHIIHITDGAPTDMSPGSIRWEEMTAKLGGINGVGDARQLVNIVHFVTPRGVKNYQGGQRIADGNGKLISGQEALALLTGPKTVYEISTETKAVEQFVKMVTCVVTSVTRLGGRQSAANTADAFVQGNPNGGISGTVV